MTKVITFASGKGGVGKTTLIINVGLALQMLGEDVIIIDSNVSTPNVSLHLGMAKVGKNIQDVLEGKAKINEAIYVHPITGLRLIPASISVNDLKRKKKVKLSRALLDLIGAVDIILLDASAGLGKEAMAAIEAGDELIVVTNPEIPALTDALKTIEVARSVGVKILGVIVNKYSGNKHDISIKNVENFLGVPILGVVPEDKIVKEALRKNVPVVITYPNSKFSISVKHIAAKILGIPIPENKKLQNKFINFIKNLLRR